MFSEGQAKRKNTGGSQAALIPLNYVFDILLHFSEYVKKKVCSQPQAFHISQNASCAMKDQALCSEPLTGIYFGKNSMI